MGSFGPAGRSCGRQSGTTLHSRRNLATPPHFGFCRCCATPLEVGSWVNDQCCRTAGGPLQRRQSCPAADGLSLPSFGKHPPAATSDTQ